MGVSVLKPFEAYHGGPIKPTKPRWGVMLDALTKADMVDDFNWLLKIMLRDERTDGIVVRRIDRTVFRKHGPHQEMGRRESHGDFGFPCYQFDRSHYVVAPETQMLAGICEEYVARGMYRSAVTLSGQLYTQQLEFLQKADRAETVGVVSEFQTLLVKPANQVYSTLALRRSFSFCRLLTAFAANF